MRYKGIGVKTVKTCYWQYYAPKAGRKAKKPSSDCRETKRLRERNEPREADMEYNKLFWGRGVVHPDARVGDKGQVLILPELPEGGYYRIDACADGIGYPAEISVLQDGTTMAALPDEIFLVPGKAVLYLVRIDQDGDRQVSNTIDCRVLMVRERPPIPEEA